MLKHILKHYLSAHFWKISINPSERKLNAKWNQLINPEKNYHLIMSSQDACNFHFTAFYYHKIFQGCFSYTFVYTHRNFGQLGAKSPVYILYLRWSCKRTPNKCPHLRREHRGGAHLICRWPSASPEHIAAKWASGRRPLQPHRRTPGGCAIRVKSGIVRGWYSDLPYRNKLWFKRWRHLHSGDVSAVLNWAPTQRPGWTPPPPLGAPRLSLKHREQQSTHSFWGLDAAGLAVPETGSVWWLSSFCTKTKSLETWYIMKCPPPPTSHKNVYTYSIKNILDNIVLCFYTKPFRRNWGFLIYK